MQLIMGILTKLVSVSASTMRARTTVRASRRSSEIVVASESHRGQECNVAKGGSIAKNKKNLREDVQFRCKLLLKTFTTNSFKKHIRNRVLSNEACRMGSKTGSRFSHARYSSAIGAQKMRVLVVYISRSGDFVSK